MHSISSTQQERYSREVIHKHQLAYLLVNNKHPKQLNDHLACNDDSRSIHFLVTPETPFNYETALPTL